MQIVRGVRNPRAKFRRPELSPQCSLQDIGIGRDVRRASCRRLREPLYRASLFADRQKETSRDHACVVTTKRMLKGTAVRMSAKTHDTAKGRAAREISLCMIERCVATFSDRRPRCARHSSKAGSLLSSTPQAPADRGANVNTKAKREKIFVKEFSSLPLKKIRRAPSLQARARTALRCKNCLIHSCREA
jgi:hypothetical protein